LEYIYVHSVIDAL